MSARPIIALFTLLAGLISASAVYAQSTMVVDGNCQFTLSTSSTTPAVQINPSNGNMTVTSQSGINCTPATVTLTVPSPVNVNSNFNVSWTSSGTTSCSMSGGTAGWAGSGRPTVGSLPLVAPSTPGTIAFNISCATGGTPVTDSKNIVFQGTSASVNLTSSSNSVPVGSNFTMSWTSTGTTSCTPSGGTGTTWASQGTLATTGSVNLTAPGTAASNVSFGISCATGGSPVIDTELVSFTSSADCSNVPLPPNIGGFAQQTWTTLYGGAQFPRVYSSNKTFSIGSGQGLRLAITPTVPTNGDSANGSIVYDEASTVARAGFITISRCPGDFRTDVLNVPAGCDGIFVPCTNKCSSGPVANGQLSLRFRLQGTANNVCNITPGQQYYVNMHFGGTSTPGPDGAFCAGSSCAIIGGTSAFFSKELSAIEWLQGDMIGLSDPQPKLKIESDTSTP